MECIRYELGALQVQAHGHFKAKQWKQRLKYEQARENRKTQGNAGTHGRAPPTTGRGGLCPVRSVRARSAEF